MANMSKYVDCVSTWLRWIGGCFWIGALHNLKNVTSEACNSEHPTSLSTPSTSLVGSKDSIGEEKDSSSENSIVEEKDEGEESTSVEGSTNEEDGIDQSQTHWSQLVEHGNDGKEVAEENNVEVFKTLQSHPTWGHFFRTFGDGGKHDYGKLVVGEKFAAGGQAELYHATVTWKMLDSISQDQLLGSRWVLKVFRKGTFLRDLHKQWPQGMFRRYEDITERTRGGNPQSIKVICNIQCGILLPNGRFAFLMVRENEDLRSLIDRKMKERNDLDCGPFPMWMVVQIMYVVAQGIYLLHNLDIVHRDIKASNILCALLKENDREGYAFYVADYECSIGVVGTGFFRAPEILQAIKDRVVYERPDVFSKASDIYGYGMMCYEILTGKLPFQGHRQNDFDLVLSGQQLELPHYVDEWIHDLLQWCWEFDPSSRPTIEEILKVLEANSEICRTLRQQMELKEKMSQDVEVRKKLYPKYQFDS